MHQPSWLWMFPYLGRLTNKHITTTCPQRRAWVDEQRKLGFDGLKFRMPELRRLLYDDVIVLHKKRSFFITDITSIGTLMLSKGSVYQNTLYQEPIMERQRIFSKRASWLRQNTWKLYTESIYFFANAQFLKPEVMLFISRTHVSWVLTESSNTVNTCNWNNHRILAH